MRSGRVGANPRGIDGEEETSLVELKEWGQGVGPLLVLLGATARSEIYILVWGKIGRLDRPRHALTLESAMWVWPRYGPPLDWS